MKEEVSLNFSYKPAVVVISDGVTPQIADSPLLQGVRERPAVALSLDTREADSHC